MITYTAYMPMDRMSKVVHLVSLDPNVYYKFVSVERNPTGATGIQGEHRIFLSASVLDEGTIRDRLAQINMCERDQIRIVYERAAKWKIDLLRKLEEEGVVREDQPVPTSDYRHVAYWPFEVRKADKLPECLRREFLELGEIRW